MSHKFLRSLQTFFPFLHDLRFKVRISKILWTKKPHEYDFYALQYFEQEKNQIILDIGANRGEAIASILTCTTSPSPIIAFEPNSIIWQKTEKRFSKQDRITVINCGLGSEDGQFDLYVPFYRRWMFDGLASFDYDAASEWLVDRLWNFNPGLLTVKKLKCEIKRLDDFGYDPFFIKIDVQGFELEVLKGGAKTLERSRPILLIESITEDIMNYLSKFEYQFYSFENNTFIPRLGRLNTFCIPKDKAIKLTIKPQ